MNRARVIDGLILAAIVSIAVWVVLSKDHRAIEGLVGQPAPQFRLKTLAGEVTGPPNHTGKIVLLDFWATWCDPCLRQMPAIESIVEENEDLVVLPINVDEPSVNRTAAMKRFLDSAGVDFDSLIDDGAVHAMYRIDTIPALVLISPDGRIAYASSGVHTAGELRDRIDAVERGTK